MATINQLRTERLAYFRELKRALRSVDSEVEKVERKIDQVLNRKRNVPEVDDFEMVTATTQAMGEKLRQFDNALDQGVTLFIG